MIFNYIKIAIRTLYRNRLFSLINIFGLALSMSVCMMVIIRTKDQLGYDRFHPHADRTYRIITQVQDKKSEPYYLASTPLPLNQALAENKTAEAIVPVYAALHQDAYYGDKIIKVNGAFTRSSFFHVFGFKLAEGDERTALTKPDEIILSKDAAKKIFGNKDALGKTVKLDKLGVFQVSGVLETPPGKTHLDFDIYASDMALPALEKNHLLPEQTTEWNPFQPEYTYVLLKEGTDIRSFEQELNGISAWLNRHTAENKFSFSLQAMDKITPGSTRIYNDIASGAGWAKIITEMSIALLILLAGCFNYINLTIARALTRAKEVGIRKVAGARRHQIFLQYIIESVLISLFALAIAFVLLQFILEYKPFNDDYAFMPDVKIDPAVVMIFLLFSLLTGLIAGALPAWLLSSFRPVEVLKNIRIKKVFGNISLQKALVVFQFSLSLIILIFLSSFYLQFRHLARVDTGFRSRNIMTIQLDGADPELLLQTINNISGVKEATAVSDCFGKHPSGSANVKTGAAQQAVRMNYYFADEKTASVFDLKWITGKAINDQSSGGQQQVIINETAAKALFHDDMQSVPGQPIMIDDTTQAVVSGVVKDFYYQGAGQMIQPLLLRQKPGGYHYIAIHTSNEQPEILHRIQAALEKSYHKAFQYTWFDQELKARNQQTATLSLLGFLGIITLTIGTLGLLGLVVYTVETRRKEISIRKVIGAEVRQVVGLLSKGYIRLLLLSGLIALPIGYIIARLFLQNFANRIQFGLIHLCGSFLFLLVIGSVVIISQTWKAAVSNPAPYLKPE